MQSVASRRISGVLDPDRIAGTQHGADDQRQGTLEAAGHPDLLRPDGDAPAEAEIAGNHLAQRTVAGGIRIGQIIAGDAADFTGRQRRPELAGKRIEGGQTHAERQDMLRRVARPLLSGTGAAPERARDGTCGHVRRDHRSGRTARQQHAFAGEYRIGRFHRTACDTELTGKTARRRQAPSGGQRAGENGGPQARDDLPVNGTRGAWVQDDGQVWHGPVSLQLFGPRL